MSLNICDHLRQIHLTAIDAVRGDRIMSDIICFDHGLMKIKHNGKISSFNCKNKAVYLIGAGKAVLDMCYGFLKVLDKQKADDEAIKIKKGILSLPIGIKCEIDYLRSHNINVYFGAKNNLPDEDAVKATNAILKLIDNTIKVESRQTIVITLISGGASALLVSPKPPLNLEQKRQLTEQLMASGCIINELNQVRRCLSHVKGGQLAMKALSDSDNVEMISLIASDIIGDPLDLIGSGPTVIPMVNKEILSTPIDILNKYKINVNEAVSKLFKQLDVKEDVSRRLHNLIIVNNRVALEGIKFTINQLGYKINDMGNMINGEASLIGSYFAEIAREATHESGKICWVGGGETVVTLTPNHGKGGRCQELALKFLIDTYSDKLTNFALLAAGTDGQDGPTPISGIVYQYSNQITQEIYDQARLHLTNHDSYSFWSKHLPSSMINTKGPTGVNVMDIYCLIKV